jgi:glutathione S-transferase
LERHTKPPVNFIAERGAKPMTGTKPRLITFGISHYCEKARWALDWHGVDYDEIGWPPGLHVILSKLRGAKHTTVPILLDGKRVIQGSGAIIDWADDQAQESSRRLTFPSALEIERRADDGIGISARRLFYAGILPEAPDVVKPAFFANTSRLHRLIGNVMWPVTPRVIMTRYEIRPGAGQESRAKLDVELDWLDSLLADGRQYLSGDRFSRADITVASLLAPLAPPEQMKTYHNLALPKALIADFERWRDRPIMRWMAERYRTGRANT